MIDPPITYPDGGMADRVDLFPILNTHLHRGDSTVLCEAGHLLAQLMSNIKYGPTGIRECYGRGDPFHHWPGTSRVNGEPIYLMGGDDPKPPHTLRRVTLIEITGKAEAHVWKCRSSTASTTAPRTRPGPQ